MTTKTAEWLLSPINSDVPISVYIVAMLRTSPDRQKGREKPLEQDAEQFGDAQAGQGAAGLAGALSLSDVLGLGRLAADAAESLTSLVEDMHNSILDTPGLAPLAQEVTGGVTQLVYRGVRGAFQLTGAGVGDLPSLRRVPASPVPRFHR